MVPKTPTERHRRRGKPRPLKEVSEVLERDRGKSDRRGRAPGLLVESRGSRTSLPNPHKRPKFHSLGFRVVSHSSSNTHVFVVLSLVVMQEHKCRSLRQVHVESLFMLRKLFKCYTRDIRHEAMFTSFVTYYSHTAYKLFKTLAHEKMT